MRLCCAIIHAVRAFQILMQGIGGEQADSSKHTIGKELGVSHAFLSNAFSCAMPRPQRAAVPTLTSAALAS